MSSINYRVNLGFAGYTYANLVDFNNNIIANMTGNASFPAPTIPISVLETEGSALSTAMVNAAQGGTTLTALKKAARKTLVTSLRKVAAYVQSVASQDAAMLLSSGFQANSTNRAQTQLDIPVILAILNEMTTTLTVRLQPVDNARAYQVRYCVNGGPWSAIVDSTQARRIVLANLTPGTTYTVQSRGVGGSTGYSDWSDPVSHMAM
jgi:hypothetical protein